MTEYTLVEHPFPTQFASLGQEVADQGQGHIPGDPSRFLNWSRG